MSREISPKSLDDLPFLVEEQHIWWWIGVAMCQSAQVSFFFLSHHGYSGLDDGLFVLVGLLCMFLAEEIEIGPADSFCRIAQTPMRGQCLIDPGKAALQILEVNAIRDVGHERPEKISWLPRRCSSSPAPGDVLIRAQHPNHSAVLVQQRHFAGRQP